MVVSSVDNEGLVDRVAETVAVVERPAHSQTTVYSELVYAGNRRHKEQVDFRPCLHPVKYSDTAYMWLNNTRRRFVSRTFYEPRLRSRAYSETTFARPKIVEERFVSCLDVCGDEKRKWYKTSVEIKPRKFTSAKMIRCANNNYIGNENGEGTSVRAETTRRSNTSGRDEPSVNGYYGNNNTSAYLNGDLLESSSLSHNTLANGDHKNGGGYHDDSFEERIDPGASQVYIPRQLKQSRVVDTDCVTNGHLLIDFNGGLINNSNDNITPRTTDNRFSDF